MLKPFKGVNAISLYIYDKQERIDNLIDDLKLVVGYGGDPNKEIDRLLLKNNIKESELTKSEIRYIERTINNLIK